ncbi:hypothetical protein M7I_2198 [Glarea lozoyensis 74030]|uniref:Uncharacterized protein n=1 Tax=Glarea lozoyensis (strain ATCC 74030 / MF5533) TaxID=1104152 RepID=H0EI50_GLAL7|nr:hypothetical protein M7I_2198 [Glarea lozoyensis 74030]
MLLHSFNQPFVLVLAPWSLSGTVSKTIPPTTAAIFVGSARNGFGQLPPEKWARLCLSYTGFNWGARVRTSSMAWRKKYPA